MKADGGFVAGSVRSQQSGGNNGRGHSKEGCGTGGSLQKGATADRFDCAHSCLILTSLVTEKGLPCPLALNSAGSTMAARMEIIAITNLYSQSRQVAWQIGQSGLFFLAIFFPVQHGGKAKSRLKKMMKMGKIVKAGLKRDRGDGFVGLQQQLQ